MSNDSTINQLPLGVFNAMVPEEGPKVVPLTLDMTVFQDLTVDLTNQQQSGKFSFIQTLMVDNTANTQPVTITTNIIGQRLVIPAGQEAILPIFIGNPPKFRVQTTGAVVLNMWVLNVPLQSQVWGSGGSFQFTDDGYLETSDVALDALIANGGLTVNEPNLDALISDGGLNVNVISGGGGSQAPSLIINDQFDTGGHTVISAPAGAGLFWNVTGIDLTMNGDAAIAGNFDGKIAVEDDGSTQTTFAETRVYIGSAALGYQQKLLSLVFPTPIKAVVANTRINVFGDPLGPITLTTGTIGINVWGYAQ